MKILLKYNLKQIIKVHLGTVVLRLRLQNITGIVQYYDTCISFMLALWTIYKILVVIYTNSESIIYYN